ncbi:MAG: hypothetical protein JWO32_2300 [Bacteroidetes bacterium]|nr:hypothetical protein [Bacteroidota bacterium]
MPEAIGQVIKRLISYLIFLHDKRFSAGSSPLRENVTTEKHRVSDKSKEEHRCLILRHDISFSSFSAGSSPLRENVTTEEH